jgi:hypothetical protein
MYPAFLLSRLSKGAWMATPFSTRYRSRPRGRIPDDNITPEKQRGPRRRHTYTEIENQLKNMEEDMMYKTKSDSTITYKEIKKAIFDLKKGKSAGPDRILNEVIKYTNPVMINS